MKTLIAIMTGTTLMMSAAADAKFIERDSPNNPSPVEFGVTVQGNAIEHQGYGYLAQQQEMSKRDTKAFYESEPFPVQYDSKMASTTTSHDITRYLAVQ